MACQRLFWSAIRRGPAAPPVVMPDNRRAGRCIASHPDGTTCRSLACGGAADRVTAVETRLTV
jgi:hypothetical protein